MQGLCRESFGLRTDSFWIAKVKAPHPAVVLVTSRTSQQSSDKHLAMLNWLLDALSQSASLLAPSIRTCSNASSFQSSSPPSSSSSSSPSWSSPQPSLLLLCCLLLPILLLLLLLLLHLLILLLLLLLLIFLYSSFSSLLHCHYHCQQLSSPFSVLPYKHHLAIVATAASKSLKLFSTMESVPVHLYPNKLKGWIDLIDIEVYAMQTD